MTNILDTLAASKLLAIFNHHTDKPVKRFIDSADGRKRLTKLLATIEVSVADAIAATDKATMAPKTLTRTQEWPYAKAVEAPTPLPELDALFQAPKGGTPADQGIAAVKADDAARAAKPVKIPAKNAKLAARIEKAAKAAAPVETGAKAPTGSKAMILAMIARDGGVSEPEVCAALGWPRAGGTISRAIKLATFKVVKVKGEDGRTRYCAA
jgi:hypothetical protein